MHRASFHPDDPVFEFQGFSLSMKVVTWENAYGLDPVLTSVRDEGGVFVVRAARLHGAGREQVPGAAILRVTPVKPGELRVQLRAKAPEAVRGVKLLIRGRDLVGVRVADAGGHEQHVTLAVEKVGAREGEGGLQCILEQGVVGSDREFEAPPLLLVHERKRIA